MRIGFFCDAWFPKIDGVVKIVDIYATVLTNLGHEVFVVCPTKISKLEKKPNYNIVEAKYFKFFNFDYSIPNMFFSFKAKKTLKNLNFDIIHIHSPFSIGKYGFKLANKKNIPTIFTLHTQYKQDIDQIVKIKWIRNLVFNKIVKTISLTNYLWTVNPKMVEIAKEYYLDKNNSVKEINWQKTATDFLPLTTDKSKSIEFIESKLKVKLNKHLLLFVGRLVPLKNVHFINDVILELSKINNDFSFIFVGSGPEEKKLKEFVNKNNLENIVFFWGTSKDKNELSNIYKASDLYIFPSLYDTNSITMLEAASQSVPSLMIKDSPTSYFIEDQVNGFLENDKVLDFAKRINKILLNDIQLKDVGKKAFENIYVTWNEVVKKVVKYYSKIIENKNVK